MSQNLVAKDIALSNIQELEETYWFPSTHPTTQQIIDHIELIQEADLSYPIILCSAGRVMDGMHRVAKAKLLNHSTIKAVQFDVTPQPDFINVDEDQLCYDE